jgi:glycosyltransferase involved in cell wall biosynthesis
VVALAPRHRGRAGLFLRRQALAALGGQSEAHTEAQDPQRYSWAKLTSAITSPKADQAVLRSPPASGILRASSRRYLPAILHAIANLRPRRLMPGAVYMNVSHFGLEQPRLLERLSAKGLLPIVMIHDLIPVVHPEFCSPNAAALHLRRIDSVLAYAALVITNSMSTADVLAQFARERGARIPPTQAAPLGLEEVFLNPPRDLAAEPFPIPSSVPYFVCVGTLEPRKNLSFLLTLWRRLADRMGEATPPLVLVGQRGWENESIIDHLERSPPVLRFVHEANRLDDHQLACLIRGARALLSPSFSEGFNLPINEAMALGTPVIASDIAVHRELAEGARLIDPLDGVGWLEAIEMATRRRPFAEPVERPGWPDHFAIVEQAMALAPQTGHIPPAARVGGADHSDSQGSRVRGN